jgi:hypothetical protein
VVDSAGREVVAIHDDWDEAAEHDVVAAAKK